METNSYLRSPQRKRLTAALWLTISTVAGTVAFAQESEFAGLIRGKTPDRGSYQPPTLPGARPQAMVPEPLDQPSVLPQQARILAAVEESYEGDNEGDYADEYVAPVVQSSYQVRPMPVAQPQPPQLVRRTGHVHQPSVVYDHPHHEFHSGMGGHLHEPTCGIGGYGCDGGCDSLCGGCDACCGPTFCGPFGLLPFGICRQPNQWFGAAEVMLMFRSGDRLPVLATGNNGATLFGGDRYYDDMTPGGRFKVGTWLDPYRCNSLVFRGWGAGKESFGFHVDSAQSATIGRPFINVSPAAPNPPNDTLLVASGNAGLTGNLNIRGTSEVYGGDIAIHRQWQAGLGGVIEVLYGYQHMRMAEDLDIRSTTFDGPNNLVIDRRDFFEARNEFHGGELGFATRYREGCWSFDGMIKVAAGSIRRSANLVGVSAGIGDTEGLLVRSSNEGRFRNSTFGWVPELDATIGYRYTQNLDFTIGYHVIAMTDALQVSGVLDPQLAVNADFPNSQPARPAFRPNYDTFYVQSIRFGLQYVY